MKAKRMGRPPRRDRPTRVNAVLAGAVAAWLKRRARREGLTMSDLVAKAVARYREQVEREGDD